MRKLNVELIVGLFMIVGFLGFVYLSVKLGDVDLFGDSRSYALEARFNSISGLKEGAFVEIAGVKVGKVAQIHLDKEAYQAVVTLAIDSGVPVQEDSIASIRTSGIIGDRYIDIAPGGAEDYLQPGAEIEETESAIILEELVSKYIFEGE